MIKKIYEYREFLKTNVKKDIRGKYKGSFLGVIWSFLNPLLSALVYALVFPFILKNTQDNYVVYIIIGIIPWTFFTTVISQGTYCILANSGVIKKVYFPREILPISVVTSGLVNFLISLIIIFLFLIFSGIGFSKYLIFLPLVIIIQYILLLGIVFISSAINVYVRDTEHLINFFVSMLFYATPILYSPSTLPSHLKTILNLNPMATVINGYRDILYYQVLPDFKMLFIVLILSVILLFIGSLVFSKLEKGFAEEV